MSMSMRDNVNATISQETENSINTQEMINSILSDVGFKYKMSASGIILQVQDWIKNSRVS